MITDTISNTSTTIRFITHKFEYGCVVVDNYCPQLIEKYWTHNESYVEFRNTGVATYQLGPEFNNYQNNEIINTFCQLREEYLIKYRLHKQLYPTYDRVLDILRRNESEKVSDDIANKIIRPKEQSSNTKLEFIAAGICNCENRVANYREYWFVHMSFDGPWYMCYAQYVHSDNDIKITSEHDYKSYDASYRAWFIGQNNCKDTYRPGISEAFITGIYPHTIAELNAAYDEFWRDKFAWYLHAMLLECSSLQLIFPADILRHIARVCVQYIQRANNYELELLRRSRVGSQ